MKVTKVREFAGHSAPIYQVCEGREREKILTCSGDRFIAEWDLHTGAASSFSIKLEETCYSVYCDIKSQVLLAGTSSGHLHVIDLKKKSEIHNFKVHTLGIFDILYVAEHELLIVAGGDGVMSVWNPKSWKLLRQFQVTDAKLRSLSYANDRLLVTSSNGKFFIFDLPWLNELEAIEGHEGGCYSAVHHPTKKVIVTGGSDGHLRFWTTETPIRPVRAIPAHNFGIYGIEFSPNHQWAVTVSRDKTIKVWNASDFEVIARIERPKYPSHTHSINDVVWLNEMEFATVGDDRKIMVWRIE